MIHKFLTHIDKIFQKPKTTGALVVFLFLFLIISVACSQHGDNQETGNQTFQATDNDAAQKANNTMQLAVNESVGKNENSRNSKDNLDNGFSDYGVAVPFATSRGTVATIDEQGHHIIMTWLYDHRGTYSLLMIDTDSGQSKQVALPFTGDSFTSLLSSQNRYYTHFDGHFVEFDPNKHKFTFIGKTSPGSAMSMTEDDRGVIWAVSRPNCSLVSYNPKTKKLTDYGVIYSSKARQNPRSIAADANGWIYVTAGPAGQEQVIAFNPEFRKKHAVQKKPRANISLFRGRNGKVYGKFNERGGMELYEGQSIVMNKNPKIKPKQYITGNQTLYHRTFSDGKRIRNWVSSVNIGFLGLRNVTIEDTKSGQSRTVSFDYKTEGSNIMGVAASPNGTIVGGTNFPMFFFELNPVDDTWKRHGAYGQFNTLATSGNKLFIGSYPRGDLLEWDTDHKWVPTKEEQKTNPQHLAKAYPFIIRPNDLLIYPNDKTVIMAGRPKGGRTTGGVLFWNWKTQKADIVKQFKYLPNQSTQSLVALSGDRVLGGTTNKPGDSGGVRKAKEANLYILNLKTRRLEWRAPVIPGTQSYQDLCVTVDGLVMGVADNDKFFVFDPQKRKIIYRENLEENFESVIPYTQGQRSFIKDPDGGLYLLLVKGILKINPDTFKLSLLAESPQNITGGGAYLDGRIYFTSGGRSHVFSYAL